MLRKLEAEKTPNLSDGPLFVVGIPRSGTSLLHVLVNQHPKIALMFEGDLPLLPALFWSRKSKLQWLERWNLWNKSVERHQIHVNNIPEGVTDVRTATEATYREYAEQKSATIWGDKTPDRYDSLVLLANTFPNARFVIIWRDPADVCSSMIRARNSAPRFRQRGLTHRALLGCQELGFQRDLLRRRGVPVHELEYEALVQNPAQEMQRICRFLKVPFHARMATLKDADRSAVHAAEHNAMVNGERIVPSRKREEVLPLALKRKIDRYKRFWQKANYQWASFPVSEAGSAVPSMAERFFDQARFRIMRRWDRLVALAYCVSPLRWLTAYRAWQGHPYLNETWQEYVRRCNEQPQAEQQRREETVGSLCEAGEVVMSVDHH